MPLYGSTGLLWEYKREVAKSLKLVVIRNVSPYIFYINCHRNQDFRGINNWLEVQYMTLQKKRV
jgi:hypothetical protein